MSIVLATVTLAGGFALGRLYQWVKAELFQNALNDPSMSAHEAASDIAAQTRRADEQINRLGQWRPRDK